MGSIQSFPEAYTRIYQNLLQIQSPGQKAQMIQTILSSPEHLEFSKKAGLYGHLIHYVQVIQAGGAPPMLPGESSLKVSSNSISQFSPPQIQSNRAPQQANNQRQSGVAILQQSSSAMTNYQPQTSKTITSSQKGNEKALNYFTACLNILGLEEEVALTEELLKGAYKKAVIRAHPDKGGSEKEFEAVTRAYAYLGEIIRRIHGGRAKEGVVEAPTALKNTRSSEADHWKHVEPVALNPNKLDLNAFNKMFEETRIPDPEETGYGDWLKGGEDSASGPKFSGKFNRDVFNKAFEDEAKGRSKGPGNSLVVQEMSLASRMGYATELGRGLREDFTVAPHEGKMAFTDLKKAYTEYNTFSHETSGVTVEQRSYEQVSQSRKAAPPPLTNHEMEALRVAEEQQTRMEEQRKLRMAQQSIAENDYFERMKRLVITNK
jgi:curved DNA-binding protein CbpA